ncbi:MAG TPA: NUDIX hydrolase [bacterium]|nr:NUDIX hydrolase [bacterium]
MFIKQADIEKTDAEYGPAKRVRFEPIRMQDFEFRMLTGSMKDGRHHDVTMFIERDGGYVGIQKPMYRDSGIFRAPSGGLNPGETLIEGLRREMLEETGLEVAVKKMLLIIETVFEGPDAGSEPWTSFVFCGCAEDGEMAPKDLEEISDIRIVTRGEMTGPMADKMLESGWGGFEYRAKLTMETFKTIDEMMLVK